MNSLKINEINADKDARSCTGVLASHPISSDLHIHNYSCTYHGQVSLLSCDFALCACVSC